MDIKEKEELLVKAADRLGEEMAKATPEQKKILMKIKEDVEKYAKEMEEKGKYTDRSSMYAVAIMLDDNLKAEESLLEAAKAYIDADYEYIKSLKDVVEAK